MNHKHIDKIGRLVVDGMMLALLWAIIALPISTFTMVRLAESNDSVLSAEDERVTEEIKKEYGDDETKDMRVMENEVEDDKEKSTEEVQYIIVTE